VKSKYKQIINEVDEDDHVMIELESINNSNISQSKKTMLSKYILGKSRVSTTNKSTTNSSATLDPETLERLEKLSRPKKISSIAIENKKEKIKEKERSVSNGRNLIQKESRNSEIAIDKISNKSKDSFDDHIN